MKAISGLVVFLAASGVRVASDTSANLTMPEGRMRVTHEDKVLHRQKRYLIFPEASSLQLVYCLTLPSIAVGQIFTVGATAALAWELPHDPYATFRRHSEVLHRADSSPVKSSNYITSKPFKTPGWSSYNTWQDSNFNPNPPKTFFNPFQQPNNYRTIKVDNTPYYSTIQPIYHHIHRRTRRDLYTKIETLFTALSKDGKACLLKAICEVSQKNSGEKGTFMEEILKAVFRVKPHDSYPDEDKYDRAANTKHDCQSQYPTCSQSIWATMF